MAWAVSLDPNHVEDADERMHAQALVEIAAVVSAHGAMLAQMPAPLSAESLQRYWSASKCRLDRWGQSLRQVTLELEGEPPRRGAAWPTARGLMEEVLTSEILTRIWTAVLCGYDRRRGASEAEPIGRSVMIGHLEARHRVLTLLARSPGIAAGEALRLNQLRRRCERWSDMLVGRLAQSEPVCDLAIDPERARDFADDLRRQQSAGGRQAWPLLLASLQSAFRVSLTPVSPNADLNAQIAESVIAAFPPALFDGAGVLHSLQYWRMAQTTDEVQGLLSQLLASPPAAMPALLRGAPRPPRFLA